MKQLNIKDVGFARVALIFYPEHDSGNGHFADQWEVRRFLPVGQPTRIKPLPDRKMARPRHFKTFVSAATFFNKCVAELSK